MRSNELARMMNLAESASSQEMKRIALRSVALNQISRAVGVCATTAVIVTSIAVTLLTLEAFVALHRFNASVHSECAVDAPQ